MLKKLLTLTLVFLGIFAMAGCEKTPEGPSDLEKITEALAEVTLPDEASSDLTFLETGLYDVEFTWESDNEDVIANDGTVTIPLFTEGDQTVEITLYATIGENTLTKTFDVTVLAATTKTDAEKVLEAKNALLIAETIVVSDLTLVDTALEATVTWASSHPEYIATDGTVVRPDDATGNVVVTLTATLTVGEATETKEFSITVQAEAGATVYTSIQDMYDNAVLDDYIEFTGIVTGVFDGGYFVSDGTLALGVYAGNNDLGAAIGDEVKVKGFYAVYNTLYQLGNIVSEEILSSGNANPLEGTAVVKTVEEMLALDSSDPAIHGLYYTITGTVELQGSYNNIYIVDGSFQILIYYYSLSDSLDALEAQVGKEVTITVFYYTNHGTNGPMVAYDGGVDGITVNTLPDDQALAADLAALESEVPAITVGDVTLPTEGANGTVFSGWTSSDTAVLGDDGTFVALGATTVTVTFTGTATKGALTETVTVDVVVPLNSTVAEVLAMEVGDVFQVTGTVYDISYYGLFIEQGGNYIFVYYKQYDGPIVVGDEIQMLGERDLYSGLPQVALLSDMTVLSSGNAVPTAVVSTSSAIANDLVPRGTVATITGTVGVDAANYNNIIITDAAGGVVTVYYRSNASEFDTFVGQIVTAEVISYQNGTVLYSLLAADIVVETGFTDAQKAQMAADAIDLGDLSAVSMDLTLPADNATAGATITWATTDAAVVDVDGTVTLVSGSTPSATLTATITVGTDVLTRDFVVTLMDLDDSTPLTVSEALLVADGETVLVQGVITGEYYGERVIQDSTGAAIWVDSNVYGDLGDEIVVVGTLATYTSNGNNNRQLDSATKVETLTTGNALVIDPETDVTAIYAALNDMHRYTATLTVTAVDDGYGYALFNGTFDAGSGETSADAINGFKFKKSLYAPYFEDVYAEGDTIEMTFTVVQMSYSNIMLAYVELPALTDAQALLAAEGALSVPASATADLTLSAEEYGVAVSWASNDAAIDATTGAVTRPANGAGDATVTLTATLTIGTETPVDVVFTVTVPELPAPQVPALFISQYIENGNDKAVELYNPTDADIDLSLYEIRLYSNGSATVTTTISLTGTLTSGDTFFLAYSSAPDAGILAAADATSGSLNFNGNDVVELVLISSSEVYDIIGEIGVSTDFAADVTLVRSPAYVAGNTVFDLAEWTDLGDGVYSDLDTHTCDAPVS
jgi:hypothetical protein